MYHLTQQWSIFTTKREANTAISTICFGKHVIMLTHVICKNLGLEFGAPTKRYLSGMDTLKTCLLEMEFLQTVLPKLHLHALKPISCTVEAQGHCRTEMLIDLVKLIDMKKCSHFNTGSNMNYLSNPLENPRQ